MIDHFDQDGNLVSDEPQLSEREQLEAILCTAVHRQVTGDWDGGSLNCEKCRKVAHEALPELLAALGIDLESLAAPGLDDQIIEQGDLPADRTFPPELRRYLPLFVTPPGWTVEQLYAMPREQSRKEGPIIGIACVSVEHQVMLLTRMHRYGYLRPPVDLLRGN